MARQYTRLSKYATLALAATHTASTPGTELVSAELKDFVSGQLHLVVTALDLASADETYQVVLEGRDSATDAYRVLATAQVTATGYLPVSVDRLAPRMRVRTVLAGTTPSIAFSAVAESCEGHYLPGGQVVTA